MEQKKPNFIRSIKQTSLFILGLMVLNVLIKLLFNQSDFQALKKDFLALDNRVLGIFIFLLVIIVGWIIVSLIIGSIYYVIQTIKYKKVD
ncbi:hypothetical protein V6S65_13095 [Lactococcus lactis]|uniref:DUF1049 domain-containing protein n=1 Tax=Lactococcus lactis TaxID=1358 RepID=A0AAW7J0E0_9LACT|nr:hypothetical protein [Lactococcus lactis]MCT0061725.1 hypothetical protein [Lactococcus lactis subsp. lactis]MCT0138169.1 hypothetical protein [Lactococcus lactis subsp. lactis]MDM7547968.1 hypothetical protein [Lactococcus lactis]